MHQKCDSLRGTFDTWPETHDHKGVKVYGPGVWHGIFQFCYHLFHDTVHSTDSMHHGCDRGTFGTWPETHNHEGAKAHGHGVWQGIFQSW